MKVLTVAMLTAMPLMVVWQGSAEATHRTATEVRGSAFGYRSSVSLFGGPPSDTGPTPTVTLPSAGSASPITATAASGSARSGPATFFSSGRVNVGTRGTTGSTGSVTSSVSIESINTSGQEVFTASNLAGSCTASESGVNASTTITGGTLKLDSGDDDPTNSIPDHPPVDVIVPTNPVPDLSYEGHTHPGNTSDNFRYVFNEQVTDSDGSVTVNAAHEYLLGPTAIGDLLTWQSVCGVTTTPAPVDTKAPRVVSTVPAPGATGVSPTVNVKATFSEAMKAASVNRNTLKLFRKGSTTKVAASVSYDASTRRGILNPTNALRRGITYKVVVTTYAQDTSGNRLDQNATLAGRQQKAWMFKVRN